MRLQAQVNPRPCHVAEVPTAMVGWQCLFCSHCTKRASKRGVPSYARLQSARCANTPSPVAVPHAEPAGKLRQDFTGIAPIYTAFGGQSVEPSRWRDARSPLG